MGTIEKIYKADPTDTTYTDLGHEDRFRIVLDKNIPFAGTSTNQKGFYAYTSTDNQLGGRRVRVLQGLHEGRLRDPVGLRRLSGHGTARQQQAISRRFGFGVSV